MTPQEKLTQIQLQLEKFKERYQKTFQFSSELKEIEKILKAKTPKKDEPSAA